MIAIEVPMVGETLLTAVGDQISQYGATIVVIWADSGDIRPFKIQCITVAKPLFFAKWITEVRHVVAFCCRSGFHLDLGAGTYDWL